MATYDRQRSKWFAIGPLLIVLIILLIVLLVGLAYPRRKWSDLRVKYGYITVDAVSPRCETAINPWQGLPEAPKLSSGGDQVETGEGIELQQRTDRAASPTAGQATTTTSGQTPTSASATQTTTTILNGRQAPIINFPWTVAVGCVFWPLRKQAHKATGVRLNADKVRWIHGRVQRSESGFGWLADCFRN